MDIDWEFLLSERVLSAVFNGLKVTALVSFYGSVGACLIGAVLGLIQISPTLWIRRLGEAYVTFFRNIPLLVQLFFWYFSLPLLLPPKEYPILYAGQYELNVAALTIALVLGAFVAEVVRSGIEAVSFGQWEAGLATGLNRFQVFRYVISPQLGPIVLPGLANEMLNVVKSSAFAMTIGLPELTWQAQAIEAETFKGFEAMTVVTITYLIVSVLILLLFRAAEYSVRLR
jgi:polar amino acid transport system permease protein